MNHLARVAVMGRIQVEERMMPFWDLGSVVQHQHPEQPGDLMHNGPGKTSFG